jgi:hypothetical protein
MRRTEKAVAERVALEDEAREAERWMLLPKALRRPAARMTGIPVEIF